MLQATQSMCCNKTRDDEKNKSNGKNISNGNRFAYATLIIVNITFLLCQMSTSEIIGTLATTLLCAFHSLSVVVVVVLLFIFHSLCSICSYCLLIYIHISTLTVCKDIIQGVHVHIPSAITHRWEISEINPKANAPNQFPMKFSNN